MANYPNRISSKLKDFVPWFPWSCELGFASDSVTFRLRWHQPLTAATWDSVIRAKSRCYSLHYQICRCNLVWFWSMSLYDSAVTGRLALWKLRKSATSWLHPVRSCQDCGLSKTQINNIQSFLCTYRNLFYWNLIPRNLNNFVGNRISIGSLSLYLDSCT